MILQLLMLLISALQHHSTAAEDPDLACLRGLQYVLSTTDVYDSVIVLYDIRHTQAASFISHVMSASYRPHVVASFTEVNQTNMWTAQEPVSEHRYTVLLLSADSLLEWSAQASAMKILNWDERFLGCASGSKRALLKRLLPADTRMILLESASYPSQMEDTFAKSDAELDKSGQYQGNRILDLRGKMIRATNNNSEKLERYGAVFKMNPSESFRRRSFIGKLDQDDRKNIKVIDDGEINVKVEKLSSLNAGNGVEIDDENIGQAIVDLGVPKHGRRDGTVVEDNAWSKNFFTADSSKKLSDNNEKFLQSSTMFEISHTKVLPENEVHGQPRRPEEARLIGRQETAATNHVSERIPCDASADLKLFRSVFNHGNDLMKLKKIGSICFGHRGKKSFLKGGSSTSTGTGSVKPGAPAGPVKPGGSAGPVKPGAFAGPFKPGAPAYITSSGMKAHILKSASFMNKISSEHHGRTMGLSANFGVQWSIERDALWGPPLLQERQALRNCTLRVATFHNPPWMMIDNVTQKMTGADFMLLKLLSEALDFRYTLVGGTREWGNYVNGSWRGLLGMVDRGEADLAVNGLTISEARRRNFAMSDFYFQDSFVILTSPPGLLVPLDSMSRPFTAPVWGAVVVLLVTAGPLLRLLHGSRLSFTACSLDVLRPLLLQGGLSPPSNSRGRLFLVLWFCFCFLICGHYSGVLYMHLTVVEEEATVENAEDLVQRLEGGQYDLSLQQGSFIFEVLSTPGGNDTLGKILDFQKESWFQRSSVTDILELILENPSWAIFSEKVGVMFAIASKGPWYFHLSEESYVPNSFAVAARKNSPIIPAINNVLKHVRAAGLISHWLSLVQSEEETSSPQLTAHTLTALSLSHLAVGFAVLAAGFSLSAMAFVAELYCDRKRRNNLVVE